MASDLVVQFGGILEQPTIFPEEKGRVNVTVKNQGDTSVSGPVNLKLYASTDNQLERDNLNTLGPRGAKDPLRGTDELLGTLQNQNINLAPGQSKIFTLDFAGSEFRTASVVSPGLYYLVAEVEPGNNVVDSNRGNNTSNQLITQGDVVIQWNSILLNAIQATGKGELRGTAPTLAARNQAIVHAAIYDAVNSIEQASGRGNTAYLPNLNITTQTAGASQEAAAVEAAYRTLVPLFVDTNRASNPQLAATLQAEFDAQRNRTLAAIPNGSAKDRGIAIGQTVANQILNDRQNDGSDQAQTPYTEGVAPGSFRRIPAELQPNPENVRPPNDPLAPGWHRVQPFAIDSVSSFRPAGPPEFGSPDYARDINEVRVKGGLQDTAATKIDRTFDQTEVAQFWAYDRDDTFRPPGQLNEVAQEVALAKGNTLAQNARLFALLNIAQADASIVGWDAKYIYNQLRPITAIQNGDTDNNPDTTADKDWRSLLATPNFPDYVSGHSLFGGASTRILELFYGSDNFNFDLPSQELPGVARSYTKFSQVAQEDALSRLYGGIHIDLATVDGVKLGQNVADSVFNSVLT